MDGKKAVPKKKEGGEVKNCIIFTSVLFLYLDDFLLSISLIMEDHVERTFTLYEVCGF